jgi:DNA-directed RNA polymerase subunit RPC12/RpoP
MTTHKCSECGRPLEGRRDKLTCSTRCRVRRTRRLAKLTRPS